MTRENRWTESAAVDKEGAKFCGAIKQYTFNDLLFDVDSELFVRNKCENPYITITSCEAFLCCSIDFRFAQISVNLLRRFPTENYVC